MATPSRAVDAPTLELRAGLGGAWLLQPDGSSTTIDSAMSPYGRSGVLDAQEMGIQALEGDATAQIARLNLTRNALEAFANVTLPSSLTDLDLSDNRIERFELVSLPPSLRRLDLSGNPLRHVEIRASDVGVWAGLELSPRIQLQQTQCLDAHASVQRIERHSVCVVSDARFDEKRLRRLAVAWTLSGPTAAANATVSSSSSRVRSHAGVSMIVGGSMLAVIVVFALWMWWRRRRRHQQQQHTALDQTYRGSSTAHSEYVDALTPDTAAMIAHSSGYRRKSFSSVPQCATSLELYRRLAATVSSASSATPPASPATSKDDSLLDSPTLETFRLSPDEIEEGELLHQGLFTMVFKASRRIDDGAPSTTVAIRKLSVELSNQAQSAIDFMGDIALSSVLQHPNLVSLVGFYNWPPVATDGDTSSPVAVSEFMARGDLWSLLKQHSCSSKALRWLKRSSIPKSKAEIALDVADALVYLHSQTPSVLALGLKAQKVLLAEDYTPKLCSLSVNRTVQRRSHHGAQSGASVAWLAPEILRGEAPSALSDVYSFGVLLTELDTCSVPFADALDCDDPGVSQQDQLAMLLSSGCIRPALSMRCPGPVQRLATRCLSFHPSGRPHAVGVQRALRALVGGRSSASSPRPSAELDGEESVSIVDLTRSQGAWSQPPTPDAVRAKR